MHANISIYRNLYSVKLHTVNMQHGISDRWGNPSPVIIFNCNNTVCHPRCRTAADMSEMLCWSPPEDAGAADTADDVGMSVLITHKHTVLHSEAICCFETFVVRLVTDRLPDSSIDSEHRLSKDRAKYGDCLSHKKSNVWCLRVIDLNVNLTPLLPCPVLLQHNGHGCYLNGFHIQSLNHVTSLFTCHYKPPHVL